MYRVYYGALIKCKLDREMINVGMFSKIFIVTHTLFIDETNFNW